MKRAMALLIPIVLWLSSCETQSVRGDSSLVIAGPSSQEMPRSFDACADGEGGLVAAWGTGTKDYRGAVMVSRFDAKRKAWSTPVRVFQGPGFVDGTFLASRGREIHLFSARRLRHWMSEDAGAHWKELAPVYSDSMSEYKACAIALRGPESLVLAALHKSMSIRVDSLYVDAIEIRGGRPNSIQTIARYDSGQWMQPRPVVSLGGDKDEIYFAFNRSVGSRTSQGWEVSDDGRILVSAKSPSDPAWGVPLPVTGVSRTFLNPSSEWGGGLVQGLVITPDKRHLLYVAGASYDVDLHTSPRHPEKIQALEAKPDQYSTFNGVMDEMGSHGWLGWMDDSRKKSDRDPSRPETYILYMDRPDWDNNDFVVTEVRRDSTGKPVVGKPEFLTGPQSYVRYHRLVLTAGRAYAVWVGKKTIGRSAEGGESVRIQALRLD